MEKDLASVVGEFHGRRTGAEGVGEDVPPSRTVGEVVALPAGAEARLVALHDAVVAEDAGPVETGPGRPREPDVGGGVDAEERLDLAGRRGEVQDLVVERRPRGRGKEPVAADPGEAGAGHGRHGLGGPARGEESEVIEVEKPRPCGVGPLEIAEVEPQHGAVDVHGFGPHDGAVPRQAVHELGDGLPVDFEIGLGQAGVVEVGQGEVPGEGALLRREPLEIRGDGEEKILVREVGPWRQSRREVGGARGDPGRDGGGVLGRGPEAGVRGRHLAARQAPEEGGGLGAARQELPRGDEPVAVEDEIDAAFGSARLSVAAPAVREEDLAGAGREGSRIDGRCGRGRRIVDRRRRSSRHVARRRLGGRLDGGSRPQILDWVRRGVGDGCRAVEARRAGLDPGPDECHVLHGGARVLAGRRHVAVREILVEDGLLHGAAGDDDAALDEACRVEDVGDAALGVPALAVAAIAVDLEDVESAGGEAVGRSRRRSRLGRGSGGEENGDRGGGRETDEDVRCHSGSPSVDHPAERRRARAAFGRGRGEPRGAAGARRPTLPAPRLPARASSFRLQYRRMRITSFSAASFEWRTMTVARPAPAGAIRTSTRLRPSFQSSRTIRREADGRRAARGSASHPSGDAASLRTP